MNCLFALVGIGMMAGGLFVAFNIELMWEWRQRSNARAGVKSERTEAWEQTNRITALLIIVAGIGCIALHSLSLIRRQSIRTSAGFRAHPM